MNRTYQRILLSFFLVVTISTVKAFSVSIQNQELENGLRQIGRKIQQLETLIIEAEQQEADASYEKATLNIARYFSNCIVSDAQRVEANEAILKTWKKVEEHVSSVRAEAVEMPYRALRRTDQILDEAIAALTENKRTQKRRAGVFPREVLGGAFSNDYFFVNGHPVFLGGYNLQLNSDDHKNVRDSGGNVTDFGPRIDDLFPAGDEADEVFVSSEIERLNGLYSNGMYAVSVLKWPKIPDWILEKYEGITQSTGHFFPVDLNHPGTEELLRLYADSYVSGIKDHPGILMYLLVNEIEFNISESVKSTFFRNDFREWVQSEHGTIENLNEVWGAQYADFVNIIFNDDLFVNPASWYDLCRFNQQQVTEFVRKYYDIVKVADPDARAYVKVVNEKTFAGTIISGKQNIWSWHSNGVDREALQEFLDINGCDTRILPGFPSHISTPWYSEDLYSLHWLGLGAAFDFMKSIAPDQPLFDGEWHVTQTLGYRNPDIPADHLRASLWLSHLLGMSANQIWGWTRGGPSASQYELRRTDSVYGGLLNQPQLVNAYARGMIEVNAYANEIIAFARARPSVYILYSEASAIQDMSYLDQQLAAYEALFFFGEKIGFVTERMLARDGVPAGCKWLVIPGNNHVSTTTLAVIRSYLNNGGKSVILGDKALSLNPHGKPHPSSETEFVDSILKISVGGVDQVIAGFESAWPDSLKNRAVECRISGSVPFGVFWRTAEFNGETLLFLLNVSTGVKEVSISAGGQVVNVAHDLISNGQESIAELALAPKQFRLFKTGSSSQ